MAIGTVKFFNTEKGFGFITPDDGGKDIFMHKTTVELAGLLSLKQGQRLSFEAEPDAKGTKAAKLKPHPKDNAPVAVTKKSPASYTKGRTLEPRISHNPEYETSRNELATIHETDQKGLQRNSNVLTRSSKWQRSYERYRELARNAVGADAVTRENYWQHAEHFYRMMNGSDV
jgi:cold shock protein